MTIGAVYQTQDGCAKAICAFHSSEKVSSPAAELIPGLMLLLYDM